MFRIIQHLNIGPLIPLEFIVLVLQNNLRCSSSGQERNLVENSVNECNVCITRRVSKRITLMYPIISEAFLNYVQVYGSFHAWRIVPVREDDFLQIMQNLRLDHVIRSDHVGIVIHCDNYS
ncbi:hypothetical protein C2G38_1218763 [Gigaspora rosea]|uniref:Uncharacterized protein n=1 Tax=Gigaspora rosea TaxID=44941 RepID=A0A397VGM2_9GLOM|nr:hypothetical protein C2G38_1218763 [Gigaspora rosea]